MNLNASPETLRAAAKVFQLAAILDDRVAQPDKARIAAWAEQIERHKLTQPDLLDGLQAYYDSPSERAIQIGDLIHHAKQVRRDRVEREDAAARDARRDRLDTEYGIQGIAAQAVLGPVKGRTPRLVAAERALQCATDKHSAQEAIAEFFAAKTEAGKATTK